MRSPEPSDGFFGPRGALSRVLPGYEERPAQRRLAEAVERVLREGGLLLAEAGTGTGKTLAYLLPAVELGRRVVVSTGTKNLQEQLIDKDIPLLAAALGRELKVAVMKGRGNYLCLLRYNSFGQAGSFRRLDEIPLFRAVEHWAPTTASGDRAEHRVEGAEPRFQGVRRRQEAGLEQPRRPGRQRRAIERVQPRRDEREHGDTERL